MRKTSVSFILFFLLCMNVLGQVRTSPEMVLQDQQVVIYYDATKGASGLQAASKVYMHAGVVLEGPASNSWEHVVGNWGQDNGVGEMEKVEGQDDLWKITLESPRKYFNVPEGQRIYRLGMVFRNASGDREGKSDQNQDIFVQVFEGYSVAFQQPVGPQLFFDQNGQVDFQAVSTSQGNLFVYYNDELIKQESNTSSISGSFMPEEEGILKVVGTSGDDESTDQIGLIMRVPTVGLSMPHNTKKGINIDHENSSFTLALHAPEKTSVYVVGDFSSWKIDPAFMMYKDGETFWITIDGLDPDFDYAFYYLVDEELKIADPYSYRVLDAVHDPEIIQSNKYPGLRAFPAESGTEHVTSFKLNEEVYQWQVTDFKKPAKERLVIYELLVRDFSDERTFKAVIDKIGYLKELGINAIELMPVNQFEGNLSWGYNPAFYFAADKFYGPANDLKKLVDECHKNGIAVLLDMVFNHSFSQSPLLKMYFDPGNNRPAYNNPWYLEEHIFENPAMRFGYAFDHGSAYFQAFMDSANHYWINEFKVDGFRFDLTKGFTTQKKGSDDSWGSRYDQERVDNLKRMANKIWEVDPESYVILEHLADNDEERELANHGMMLWGNMNHSYADAAMGYLDNNKGNLDWISYKNRDFNDPHVVGYMESHDEERMMYRLLNYGNSRLAYNTQELETALDRAKLATAFFIPLPGPKMIWQFGELGYDISIDEGGRVGVKPVLWDYADNPERKKLYEVYAALSKLKINHEVFNTDDYSMSVAGEYKTILLKNDGMVVNIIGNFGMVPRDVDISFPQTGYYWDYFSGDSIQVQGNSYTLRLTPGQFHVFINEKIIYGHKNPTPFSIYGTVTSLEGRSEQGNLNIFPNPASHTLHVHLGKENFSEYMNLKLVDIQGKVIKTTVAKSNPVTGLIMEISDVSPGLYFLNVSYKNQHIVNKVVIK